MYNTKEIVSSVDIGHLLLGVTMLSLFCIQLSPKAQEHAAYEEHTVHR
jgi:hypothetical protein